MPPAEDRRFEPRTPTTGAALIVGMGLELTCKIVDASGSGRRIRLERQIALPPAFILIEIASGVAADATVVWAKGREAGLRITAAGSLQGLTSSRLAAARAAWLKRR